MLLIVVMLSLCLNDVGVFCRQAEFWLLPGSGCLFYS
jgi:hypothetical protein